VVRGSGPRASRRLRRLGLFGPATTGAPKTEILLNDPIFAESYSRVLHLIHEGMGWPLPGQYEITESPALSVRFEHNFVHEVAAQLSTFAALQYYGFRFDAIAGVSLGEIAAAQAAGATTVDEAIRITTAMIRDVSSSAGGDLLTVNASISRALNALGSCAAIPILGWPDESVWAVRDECKAELHDAFVTAGLSYTMLDIGCMPHTDHVNRLHFAQSVRDEPARPPSIEYFSSSQGGLVESRIDSGFWERMCAEPLRFMEMSESIERERFDEVIMIGTISIERHLFSNVRRSRRPRFKRAEDMIAEYSRANRTG
jgi:acyl transferase domain-containing protein